jgi:peptidoglycan/LPS O-acetylase OafA/YrhL
VAHRGKAILVCLDDCTHAANREKIVMQGRTSRIAAIDLLRTLAALAVLAHHWNWLVSDHLRAAPLYPERLARHGGFFGVSLFFIISGFVILASARGVSAERFVANRAIRLYPAFWICCTVTWLATRHEPMGKTFVEYLCNLTMFPQALGMPMIDGVYWTLALEAKFYLLIAAIIAFGSLARIEPALWIWLAISCVPANPVLADLAMAPQAPFS